MPDISDEQSLGERVKTNLVYYQANYLAIFTLFLLYVWYGSRAPLSLLPLSTMSIAWSTLCRCASVVICSIARPPFILAGLIVAGGGYALFILRKQPIVIGKQQLSNGQIAAAFAAGEYFLRYLFLEFALFGVHPCHGLDSDAFVCTIQWHLFSSWYSEVPPFCFRCLSVFWVGIVRLRAHLTQR